jgi:hypothetical protein
MILESKLTSLGEHVARHIGRGEEGEHERLRAALVLSLAAERRLRGRVRAISRRFPIQ